MEVTLTGGRAVLGGKRGGADEATSAIQPVYENGVLLSDCTWAEVTGRAAVASPSPYVVPDAPGAAEA